jgi:C-terminal processing protease CtpA/Prc
MYFDEYMYMYIYNEAPFTSSEFKMLEGNLAYMALNTFMDPSVVTSFEEKLPILRGCSGFILDLRKNPGGQDDDAYRIASYFLRQPADRLLVHTRKNIGNYRAAGSAMKDTPPDRVAELADWQRESLLCYRKQWFEEAFWGQVQPATELLDRPTVILTSSETGSASEDFLMALETGQSGATRICTVRMPWPEEVALKGIEPHVRVEPTVDDVIRNEDRVLQTAIRYLRGDKDSRV